MLTIAAEIMKSGVYVTMLQKEPHTQQWIIKIVRYRNVLIHIYLPSIVELYPRLLNNNVLNEISISLCFFNTTNSSKKNT